jgi:hypothetical protein
VSGWWPPRALYGLHVELGWYHRDRDRWLRLPVATFTCRYGCHEVATGATEVAELTARITETHARDCPGPRTTANRQPNVPNVRSS